LSYRRGGSAAIPKLSIDTCRRHNIWRLRKNVRSAGEWLAAKVWKCGFYTSPTVALLAGVVGDTVCIPAKVANNTNRCMTGDNYNYRSRCLV
jgi:hypothetical protein